METRLDNIIKKLDNCLEDDTKISSQIFGLAAASVQKNKELLKELSATNAESSNRKLLPLKPQKINKSYLENRYGSYQKAYQAYQDFYGIKCKRGWQNLLEKIQDLEPPLTLEERVVFLLSISKFETMPEITRFYGIIIKLFFGDHPPPHFHAVYGEYNALFNIETLEMIEGDLPQRARKMVIEWSSMYQRELLDMWDKQEFRKLPPLK